MKVVDGLLERSAHLYQMEPAPNRHRQYVANVIWNDGRLRTPDREYIQHIDDLVYLNRDTESSWVHRFVSTLLNRTGSAVRVGGLQGPKLGLRMVV